jgi:hypothetical protein
MREEPDGCPERITQDFEKQIAEKELQEVQCRE